MEDCPDGPLTHTVVTRKLVAQLRDNASDAKERHSEAREWNAGIMAKLNAPGPLGRLANKVADDARVAGAIALLIVSILGVGVAFFGIQATSVASP